MRSRLWFESALLISGWASDVAIEIEDGRITSVQAGIPPGDAERHAVALPGLCNVHSHTFQRGMAGLAERRGPTDDDFWTWREWMYRFLDRLTPDDIEAIAAQAFMEMLEGGFTRVGEFHYLHHAPGGERYDNAAETSERICAASAQTGIGLTLLPVYYAQGGFGGAAPTAGQRRFLNTIDAFHALLQAAKGEVATLDDGEFGIAPHSLRAVSPEDLKRLLSSSPERIHIHVAEQQKEVADCLAWSGQRPIEWLLSHCEVNERWCLIHATHGTLDEMRGIAGSGAVVGLCPLTEANLGDGVFPGAVFSAAGGCFGVGTDSNIQIDAAGELRSMEYAQRLQSRSRNVLSTCDRPSTGASLFGVALRGGGQAVGGTGVLCAGSSADIVSLNARSPVLAERSGDAYLDALIFAGRGREIDTVWRHGRKVVSDGVHRRRPEIETRYRTVLRRLLA